MMNTRDLIPSVRGPDAVSELISADNITEITARLAVSRAPESPPSADDLIYRIRARLADNVHHCRTDRWIEKGNRSPGEIKAQALHDQLDFEKILMEIPKGFRLVPVLYSRIKPEKNRALEDEFAIIRPQFLSHLAFHHADELRSLGICDNGIARMKQGLNPKDAEGKYYIVSVDHLIERGGTGLWADAKSNDYIKERNCRTSSPANHFNNLMLVSRKLHAFKNRLNDLQGASFIKSGQSRWVLMLAPERGGPLSGFVAPRQDETHPLHGINREGNNLKLALNYSFLNAHRLARALKEYPRVYQNGHTELEEKYCGFLNPVIKETCANITDTFNRAAAGDHPGRNAHLEKFITFYNSRDAQYLRTHVHLLPATEARLVKDAFHHIDDSIARITAKGGKNKSPGRNKR